MRKVPLSESLRIIARGSQNWIAERPIVVSIPATTQLEVSEARHAYLAKMIRRAIGFDIKIGGEA